MFITFMNVEWPQWVMLVSVGQAQYRGCALLTDAAR